MKHFTILKSFLLLFALVVGSNVWAEDQITIWSEDFSSFSTGDVPSGGTYSYACTDGGSTTKIYNEKLAGGTAPELLVSKNGGTFTATVPLDNMEGDLTLTFYTNKQTIAVSTSTEGISGSLEEKAEGQHTLTFTGVTKTMTQIVIEFKGSGTSNVRLDNIVLKGTKASGGGDTPTLEDCDFALTGAPVALSFDLYDNADAQVINYTTSSTGAVTVASSEYIDAEVGNGTITVTPKKKTNGAVEITVNQAADDTYKAGSATFTVTIDDSTPKTGTWELTALADLEEGDVFVIVGNNGNNYAMSNGVSSSNPPSAVAVTIEDNEITSDVDDNIKWNISGDATNGYTFYPNGDTDNWLYCTNSNNGVRVGTNDAKTFVISTEGYLKHNGTSRYVGLYTNNQSITQDWRCYTSINSNIASQTFAFYKYVDGTTPQKVLESITLSGEYPTTFHVGDTFSHEGMVVTATYDNASTKDVTASATFSDYDMTTAGEQTVTVSYSEGEVTKTATYNITVNAPATLTSITLSGDYPTVFEQGDEFSHEGMVVTANYDDNTTSDVTADATFSDYDMTTLGEQTVTVSYGEKTATYTITVNEKKGTAEHPYSVAEAIAATPTTGEVYIKGIVSSFYNTSIVGDGSNYRYYISDDGTTATQLLVYKGKGLNNTAFANADDLLVGDEVVIYGKLVTYQNAPEVASGNYLISLNRPVVTTPSIDLSTTTINAPSDGAIGSIEVTYNNITNEVGDVYLCDVNGDAVNGYDWLDVEINNNDNIVDYIIEANTGEARTAYMMVHATDDEYNDVYSDIITITQAAYVDPAQMTTYTLATSITPGKHYIITNGSDVAMGEQQSNNRKAEGITIENGTATVASDAGVYEFVIYGPDAKGHYTIYDETAGKEGYLYAAASGANHLKTQQNNNINGKWTITFDEGVASIVADESSNRNVMRYNSGNSIFSCYAANNNQADVYLFEKDNDTAVETTATVTFNSAGYATFASKNTLDFLDAENANYSAWQITSVDATAITFDQINTTVKAGTGILLKGEAGTTATLNILPLGGSDLTNSNKLVGITTEIAIEADQYYGLKGKEFVRLTAGTVPAGKAILPAALINSNAAQLSFIFNDGETTKINLNVNDNLDQNAPRYNMAGQRVSNSYKGIVIVNGKKVVIK